MNNISHIHSCYGCAVCAIACPKKIIDVRLNSNGFYEPYITDGAKCVNCGLCLEVCSYNHSEIALNELPKVSYGAWSRENRLDIFFISFSDGYAQIPLRSGNHGIT